MLMKRAAAILFASIAAFQAAEAQDNFGRFTSSPRVEFVDKGPGQGRDMRLLEDLTYIDPRGNSWTAQKGFQTDGASIPQVFWSFVGGPFDGAYRDAAIIHDWYCDKKDKKWQDVHRIFYYASRAAGVGTIKSKILYAAVVYGGPRWGTGKSDCYAGCHAVPGLRQEKDLSVFSPNVRKDEAQAVVDWINNQNPSLDEIDQRANDRHGMSLIE